MGVVDFWSRLEEMAFQIRPDQVFLEPSWNHFLGTDHFGRDVFSRVLLALPLTVSTSFFAVFVALVVGTFFGLLLSSPFYWMRRWAEVVFDLMITVPQIIWGSIFIVALRGLWPQSPTWFVIALAMGIGAWPLFAKVISEVIFRERRKLYLAASMAMGGSRWHIFFHHSWRAVFPAVVILIFHQLPLFMIFESFYSFAGVGFQSPQLSLGMMLADAWTSFVQHPHIFFFPGTVLAIFVVLVPAFFSRLLRPGPRLL